MIVSVLSLQHTRRRFGETYIGASIQILSWAHIHDRDCCNSLRFSLVRNLSVALLAQVCVCTRMCECVLPLVFLWVALTQRAYQPRIFCYWSKTCDHRSGSCWAAASMRVETIVPISQSCPKFCAERFVVWSTLRLSRICVAPCFAVVRSSQVIKSEEDKNTTYTDYQ